MITEKIVQGLKVSVCDKSVLTCGYCYVVYKDMIWDKTGSQGSGINYAMKIERKERGTVIVIWVKGEELKTVEYIVSPTGYIDTERLNIDITVTVEEYSQFINEVFKQPLRIGQYFCNKFSINNSVLFYTENKSEALDIISRYIKF